MERLTEETYVKVLLRLIITLSLMIALMPTCVYAEDDQNIVANNFLRLLHSDTGSQTICLGGDVNGNGRIGLAEALYILQKMAEVR